MGARNGKCVLDYERRTHVESAKVEATKLRVASIVGYGLHPFNSAAVTPSDGAYFWMARDKGSL